MALFLLSCIAVLVWQTGEWLRAPATLDGATRWVNIECGFGAMQPEAGAWQSCKLPHNWDVQKPDYGGDAWYRVSVPAFAGAPVEQALWIFASMNSEAWVNGVRLGSGGSMQEPVARHWNNALFFSIPSLLLNRSGNELIVRVHGYANSSSGLSELMTGSFDSLHGMYQTIQLRSHLLTFGSLAITMLVGLLAAMMLAWGRQETLIYFSLGCWTSSLYLLDQVVVNIPISRDLWEVGVHLSIIWSQMFFLLFLVHFLKIAYGWLRITLFTYGVLAALVLLTIESTKIITVAAIWEGISLVFMLLAILYMLWRWCAGEIYLGLMSGLALASVMMAFMYDWIPLISGGGVNPPFLFYMGPTGFIMIMAAMLMVRMANSYKYEKTLSVELGEVLWRNAKELEQARRKANTMMKHQAARDERDRIVRELHDGVGGLLANTLAVVKPSDTHIRTQLSEALNELRMMMGTLDEDADISSLLGLQRSKLQAVIDASGGRLNWEFYDIPAKLPDHASNGMQVVRIVQEAVYNALSHGKATEITMHMDASQLWIADNGCGFDTEQPSLGRGLKNIQWRAEQLKAKFNMFSNASGTKISLFWES